MIRCNFLICSKHAVSVDLILRHDNRGLNGEVPQYYMEGHHEGILTVDQLWQIQQSWIVFYNKVCGVWFVVQGRDLPYR